MNTEQTSKNIFTNFFRSLEMPLFNCKIHLELNWNNNCVMYGTDIYAGGDNANNRETTLKITSTNCMFQLSLYQLKIMQI